MIINPEIIRILDENNINRDDALTYLIALFNKLKPSYIPDVLKKSIYANGIVNRGEDRGTIDWIVPLFKETVDKTDWSWVIDKYRIMFTMIRADAGGDKKSCIEKMQLFFRNYPEVTQEEVIAAANNYLDQFRKGTQNIQYLQRADYFILKTQRGSGGVTHESRLSLFIEVVRKHRQKEELQKKLILR